MIGGDFNAQIQHEERSTWPSTLGKFGLKGEKQSENGDRLLNFCSLNDLFLANTWFTHKRRHRWTWQSPKGGRHMIDYICINNSYKGKVFNSKAVSCYSTSTDHRPVIVELELKVQVFKQKPKPAKRYAYEKLRDPIVQKAFISELGFKFDALNPTLGTPEEEEKIFLEGYHSTCSNVLGKSVKEPKRKHYL